MAAPVSIPAMVSAHSHAFQRDLRAVGERAGREAELIEGIAPHRTGYGALGVAQLEPHPRAARAQAEDLAEQLHAGAFTQLVAELGRIGAHGKRAGMRGSGDAFGACALVGQRTTS